MGLVWVNPLCSTLANAFLCHHEKNWLKDCPPHFQPILYRRYVDDTFLLFRDLSHIQLFWIISILNILIFRSLVKLNQIIDWISWTYQRWALFWFQIILYLVIWILILNHLKFQWFWFKAHSKSKSFYDILL